ncbi:type III PLP-dependent enzyme [Plantactinospora sp. WMMC1484]|uniref:type III PLP-dependent enzyme n=1 Tax=Plantactinospora sp. WMMC1484 TaxID=3404122 RepID=UPI003BF4A718
MMDDLVARFGTPLYVYRLAEVRAAARDLRAALPEETRLYYSLKANPHPAVVAELVRCGLFCEVSSSGELWSALAAGQAAQRCLFTGPAKTAAELDDALDRGVRTFSVESEVDHRRLATAVRSRGVPVDYLVRINTLRAAGRGTGLRMTGVATQFGTSPEAAVELIRDGRDGGLLNPVGVHLFPATNVPDQDDLLAEFELSLRTTAELLSATGIAGRLVSIGGGFAAPFARPGARPSYLGLGTKLSEVLDATLPGWRQGRPRVAFESGRFLVGTSGTLLTTVLDVKTSGKTTHVILDAGVNALGGMSGLGRTLPQVQPSPAPDPSGGGELQRVTLVGTLCTPLDLLSRSAEIRIPVVGDVLRIPNVGAYGLSASLLAFLSKPVPAEVVVDEDGSVVGARRIELRERELTSWAGVAERAIDE